ncbi:MAG: glutamate--tRNA ligase family protein [Pseudomonadota bacterium]|nr:glutamate--tRNA ligase family protein [Pseudomonadota bacterium]
MGRLAPTPSGLLHLGNALAFGAAWLSARGAGGRVLLRVEDLDRGRARDLVADAQRADLRWLGLDWDAEVTPQSRRAYPIDAIPTYRCTCNRAARLARLCTCRAARHAEGVWRYRTPPGEVAFVDRARGPCRVAPEDDPVVMRADGEAAYPLAVVVDDARDGVTEVVRGADLLDATAVQVRLYEAMGLVPPTWLHVPVLLGPDGRKLSKSHGSTGIGALRDAGYTPERIWSLLLPLLGLPPGPLEHARLDPARIPPGPFVVGEDGRIRS